MKTMQVPISKTLLLLIILISTCMAAGVTQEQKTLYYYFSESGSKSRCDLRLITTTDEKPDIVFENEGGDSGEYLPLNDRSTKDFERVFFGNEISNPDLRKENILRLTELISREQRITADETWEITDWQKLLVDFKRKEEILVWREELGEDMQIINVNVLFDEINQHGDPGEVITGDTENFLTLGKLLRAIYLFSSDFSSVSRENVATYIIAGYRNQYDSWDEIEEITNRYFHHDLKNKENSIQTVLRKKWEEKVPTDAQRKVADRSVEKESLFEEDDGGEIEPIVISGKTSDSRGLIGLLVLNFLLMIFCLYSVIKLKARLNLELRQVYKKVNNLQGRINMSQRHKSQPPRSAGIKKDSKSDTQNVAIGNSHNELSTGHPGVAASELGREKTETRQATGHVFSEDIAKEEPHVLRGADSLIPDATKERQTDEFDALSLDYPKNKYCRRVKKIYDERYPVFLSILPSGSPLSIEVFSKLNKLYSDLNSVSDGLNTDIVKKLIDNKILVLIDTMDTWLLELKKENFELVSRFNKEYDIFLSKLFDVFGLEQMDITIGKSTYEQYQHDLIRQVHNDSYPPNTILEVNRRGLIDKRSRFKSILGQSVIYRKASVTISTDKF